MRIGGILWACHCAYSVFAHLASAVKKAHCAPWRAPVELKQYHVYAADPGRTYGSDPLNPSAPYITTVAAFNISTSGALTFSEGDSGVVPATLGGIDWSDALQRIYIVNDEYYNGTFYVETSSVVRSTISCCRHPQRGCAWGHAA